MKSSTVTLSKHFFGLAGSLIILMLGGWLMLSPYALGFQPYGTSWNEQTQVTFWTGLGVAVLALASLLAFAGSMVSDLRHAGIIQMARKPKPERVPEPVQAREPVQSPAFSTVPADGGLKEGEFERAMASLASALAADLKDRRGDMETGRGGDAEKQKNPMMGGQA